MRLAPDADVKTRMRWISFREEGGGVPGGFSLFFLLMGGVPGGVTVDDVGVLWGGGLPCRCRATGAGTGARTPAGRGGQAR